MEFPKAMGGGGIKTWKPSVVGNGYFLELPNFKCTKGFSSDFSSLYIIKREPTVENRIKFDQAGVSDHAEK